MRRAPRRPFPGRRGALACARTTLAGRHGTTDRAEARACRPRTSPNGTQRQAYQVRDGAPLLPVVDTGSTQRGVPMDLQTPAAGRTAENDGPLPSSALAERPDTPAGGAEGSTRVTLLDVALDERVRPQVVRED